MKNKLFGLLIIVAALMLGLYYVGDNLPGDGEKNVGPSSKEASIYLKGYLGGEKIGLLEDSEVKKLLADSYDIRMDYSKAGSLAMVKADQTGMNYLFPSSQTALDLYERENGKPPQAEIVFNTPIVIYTHARVKDALMANHMITEKDGIYSMDMKALVTAIHDGKSWADLGLGELYGGVTVQTTDPRASNSGNMFAGLVATVLNDGRVVTEGDVPKVMPPLKTFFARLGYMEKSSADLFDQFLKTGVGAKPMIAGYESQLLEFAVANLQDWEKIKGDIVMVYPTPTVWSSHVYIALDENGKKGLNALMDENIQKLAWEKHGYRTSYYGAGSSIDQFQVPVVAQDVTQVVGMPDSRVMAEMIEGL